MPHVNILWFILEMVAKINMTKIEKIEFPNGDVYEGEVKNSKPHGKGTLIKTKGLEYVGEWQNGIREGKGLSKWTKGLRKGSSYNGEYKNDMPNGKGKMYETMRDVGEKCFRKYEGDLLNGQPHGYGKMTYSNKDNELDNWSYEGEMKMAQHHGKGTLVWRTPTLGADEQGDDIFVEFKYVGEFKDNLRCDGFGIIEKKWVWYNKSPKGPIYSPIHKYEGEWENTYFIKGKLYLDNELQYDGEWKYMARSKFSSGKSMRKESLKHGFGKEYTKEYVYEGNFKKDLKHGKGTFIYPNGTKIKCVYQKGKIIKFDGTKKPKEKLVKFSTAPFPINDESKKN